MVDINEKLTISKIIDQNLIDLFAIISNDFNPVHVNKEFVMKLEYPNTIAHGLISLSLVSGGLTKLLGKGNLLISINSRFINPIFAENRIEIYLEIIKIDMRFNKATVSFKGENEERKLYFKGQAQCIFLV